MFNARPDQIQTWEEDQVAMGALPDKDELWHAQFTKRARGWFFAMIHHIFGLQVAPVRVDVGALSPEVKSKKIDGVAVLRDDLGHGVMHWHDPVRSHAFSLSWMSP